MWKSHATPCFSVNGFRKVKGLCLSSTLAVSSCCLLFFVSCCQSTRTSPTLKYIWNRSYAYITFFSFVEAIILLNDKLFFLILSKLLRRRKVTLLTIWATDENFGYNQRPLHACLCCQVFACCSGSMSQQAWCGKTQPAFSWTIHSAWERDCGQPLIHFFISAGSPTQ